MRKSGNDAKKPILAANFPIIEMNFGIVIYRLVLYIGTGVDTPTNETWGLFGITH